MRLPIGRVALVVGAAACTGGGPDLNPLFGVYTLETAAGQPLPAIVLDTIIPDPGGDLQLKVLVTAGSLDVRADGTYQHRVERQLLVYDLPQPITAWVDRGTFVVTDATIRFISAFIQSVAFTAVAADGRLTIEQDLSDQGQTAVYVYSK